MKLPNLVNTTSFKLSALYLGLFSVSFITIGVVVYLLLSHTLEQQLKTSIEAEVSRLKTEYDSGGLAELSAEINEVADSASPPARQYGVLDRNGKLIAGTFSDFSLKAGWQHRLQNTYTTKPAKCGTLIIRVIPLENKLWLGVGFDSQHIEDTGLAVIHAFLWGIVLVIVLGTGGGLYLSRAFLAKVARITQSTQAIIAGDLQHRLPVAKNYDELDNLALLLNRMLDKIGALVENVQQVSNDITHDLRTPISRLKLGLEETLYKSLTEADYKGRIAGSIAEADTILDTFSALLRIAQIESNSRRSGFKRVSLGDVVESVTDALYPVAAEQGKTLTTDIEKECELMGDKELLTQLVFNLVENAILHTPEHIRIHVSLRLTNHHTELAIADNGPGIPEEQRQKVFQRFYRLEQSRTTAGNGLGLSIVAAIASLHEGTLTLFDNQPGLKVVIIFKR